MYGLCYFFKVSLICSWYPRHYVIILRNQQGKTAASVFSGVQRCFWERFCGNMLQIYRRTPMPKCDFNRVAAHFENTFSQEHLGKAASEKNQFCTNVAQMLPATLFQAYFHQNFTSVSAHITVLCKTQQKTFILSLYLFAAIDLLGSLRIYLMKNKK